MRRIAGDGLGKYGISDGDVLTVLPSRPESGRFAVVECGGGIAVLGCHRSRYYRLSGPKPVAVPKADVIRILGIVVQRSGAVHFGLATPDAL